MARGGENTHKQTHTHTGTHTQSVSLSLCPNIYYTPAAQANSNKQNAPLSRANVLSGITGRITHTPPPTPPCMYNNQAPDTYT